MNAPWNFLLDLRVPGLVGAGTGGTLFAFGTDAGVGPVLLPAGVALAVALALWAGVAGLRRWRARPAGAAADAPPDAPAEPPWSPQPADTPRAGAASARAGLDALRARLRDAVRLVETSRLGQRTGRAALYELPWALLIGSPASGKSAAVARSGLAFPFADRAGDAGDVAAGTRDCDWFFTTEGIVLDTAGRYALGAEADRPQWLGFLALLKKARPKAPINGVVVAASLAELAEATPDAAARLARSLRQRLQEVAETLEVAAPVYLVFTKVDRLAGFTGFFEDADRTACEGVWGATLACEGRGRGDAAALFDRHFDDLVDGVREMSLARLAHARGQALPPAALAFPIEFAALGPALRAFVAALFEDNPYQYPPLFRGFYFTSALREGAAEGPAGERVARRFGLDLHAERGAAAGAGVPRRAAS